MGSEHCGDLRNPASNSLRELEQLWDVAFWLSSAPLQAEQEPKSDWGSDQGLMGLHRKWGSRA